MSWMPPQISKETLMTLLSDPVFKLHVKLDRNATLYRFHRSPLKPA